MLSFFTSFLFAQKKNTPKYPSLFWEITGNGLKKPSYLFGTMHVSNKMVFHLSDSFYYALKNVDVVALELNPDIWQGQMVRLAKMQQNYASFITSGGKDYINENSFRIQKYENELKLAMSTEPTVVNSLLYRSYKAQEDFEEDTFLDLYIFQTGKKLGKRATGVEDYFETEKIVMEAYTDMAKEKKKKTIDTDGESYYDIQNKIQDAYRRGDLDLMDSLDQMMEKSDAFREKFLYKRNDIQANSIDTIIKKSSLFVGVGAAHLAGDKGVIELLRKKGYKLRPIKMIDRDAAQKERIDKLKVPVNFTLQIADDGFYTVQLPGPLFNLTGDYGKLDRRQYSDMSNGSYYLVTRVKTHAAFLGFTEEDVLKKIDSVLYEYIPGKILSKKSITKNGYNGYDILNKTRRGDLQRYNIFITPFEVLFFKMGGKENYIQGIEGDTFFSSIKLQEVKNTSTLFEPTQGGFTLQLPHVPSVYLNLNSGDGTNRWEYEAVDKKNGDAYLILKKTIHNYDFLDKDTFELSLLEESFRNEDFFDKQINRKHGKWNAYPFLDVEEKMKNGANVFVRYFIKGSDYYSIAVKTKNNKADYSSFFNSFKFTPYNYSSTSNYVDTFMHFTVSTPVKPMLDEDMRAMVVKSAKEIEESGSYSQYTSYWPKAQYATFVNDTTGEAVHVTVQQYPTYYYAKDSLRFWQNVVVDYYKNDLILHSKDSFKLFNGVQGFKFLLRDTGSSKTIDRLLILKDNYFYSATSIRDTASIRSSFLQNFFNSFKPTQQKLGESIFATKLDNFIADLFSKDSATKSKATQSISDIYYGEDGIDKLTNAINRLTINDKNYFDLKTKFIKELGFIQDTTKPKVVTTLKNIYEKTADTSLFQNEVVSALARHKTKNATLLLKELLLQDPPIFDDSYSYNTLFKLIEDSLLLAKSLFPELLQLTSLDDYKQPVLSLLVTLVDSNLLKSSDYENYFAKIYFDAKIEMKKQLGKDEKRLEEELKKKQDNGSNEDNNYSYDNYSNSSNQLNDYSILLIPQYDKNTNVQKYFEKLIKSKDPFVRINTATLLLKNKKTVADSILLELAADDKYRSLLYFKLENIKRLDKFPEVYKSQLLITKSELISSKNYDKIDSIHFLQKQQTDYNNKNGFVYFYKYRIKKEDDWKIALCGLQPINEKEINTQMSFTILTEKKLKIDESEIEQLNKQLRKLIIDAHSSGAYFYGENYSKYNKYGMNEGGYDD